MKSLDIVCQEVRTLFYEALQQAETEQAVEQVRVLYLGRQGKITELMGQLKNLSVDDKRIFGPQINALRDEITTALSEKKERAIRQKISQELARQEHFDVSAYAPHQAQGSLHPHTHIATVIEDIFMSMGFEYGTAPEVETDWFNFEALNIPPNHPARDMQDTFWLTQPGYLLRTHTSNVQAHTMRQRTPPFAVFAIGRVFRHEATDATHDFMFTQCEGFVVDKNISISNLCATLKTFMQKLFEGKNVEIRMRPSYYPFVEPGFDVDISCIFCTGGCSVCKKTGWIELCGAGLIHPNVLKHCGIDSTKYSGFAFGTGIERLAMLKYGINDIRLFRSGKVDFLKQF